MCDARRCIVCGDDLKYSIILPKKPVLLCSEECAEVFEDYVMDIVTRKTSGEDNAR